MHAGDIIPSPLDILRVIGRMLHSVTTFVQPATLGPFVANSNRMETPYLLEHEIITFFWVQRPSAARVWFAMFNTSGSLERDIAPAI